MKYLHRIALLGPALLLLDVQRAQAEQPDNTVSLVWSPALGASVGRGEIGADVPLALTYQRVVGSGVSLEVGLSYGPILDPGDIGIGVGARLSLTGHAPEGMFLGLRGALWFDDDLPAFVAGAIGGATRLGESLWVSLALLGGAGIESLTGAMLGVELGVGVAF